MILPLENYDLSLLDICPIEATFFFTFIPLEVSETTIPFGLLRLAEQLVPCSTPVNALARLRPFANTVFTAPFKLGPPHLYGKCFYVCLSRSDTTLSQAELILPKPCGTPTYPSAKVSLPRDLLESLRLIKEKTGQKK
ncbi:hypothetical protein GW17_00019617 [Ensete ventricosum]|nr:hypothetical protein GW17_00019617 [Ensete ventricosum]